MGSHMANRGLSAESFLKIKINQKFKKYIFCFSWKNLRIFFYSIFSKTWLNQFFFSWIYSNFLINFVYNVFQKFDSLFFQISKIWTFGVSYYWYEILACFVHFSCCYVFSDITPDSEVLLINMPRCVAHYEWLIPLTVTFYWFCHRSLVPPLGPPYWGRHVTTQQNLYGQPCPPLLRLVMCFHWRLHSC